jgi:cytochrome b subunit of formate dehydrogenase
MGRPRGPLSPQGALLALTPVLLLFAPGPAEGQPPEMCLECHGKEGVARSTRTDRKPSLHVDAKTFRQSAHGRFKCEDCHQNAYAEHRATVKRLTPVNCARCHKAEASLYQESVHGRARARKDPYAPACHHCHGMHDILPSGNPKSHTYVINVPSTCSACHREGAPMMQVHDISQKEAVSNYSMSDHANGVFKRGLIVSAVCTSCHGSHQILKHQDSRSSINQQNVSKTCMKCHAQIERVHKKVIRGSLWEKEPGRIPACIDCHPPHRVRKVFYESDLPDKVCLGCHGDPNLTKEKDGQKVSLHVDPAQISNSAHAKLPCVKCHMESTSRHRRPCQEVKRVDCSICHAETVRDFERSFHGRLVSKNDPNAPTCTLCHGTHGMQVKRAPSSPTFARNIPELCGRCHQEGKKAAVRYTGPQRNIIKSYTDSTHGRGLLRSGLLVTAKCTDCHSSHRILPAADPESSVHHDRIAETCAKCHLGVYEELKKSIHGPGMSKAGSRPPVCVNCHLAHSVSRVEQEGFRQGIYRNCGYCHEEVAKTYFDTFHGKVSVLGTARAAKCHDCHGAHNVLPVTNPESSLSFWNIVGTCQKCHPSANRKFTGYLTHATHHDSEKYPALYYTFWFMTTLLISTLAFFGLHNLLWLRRTIRELLRRFRKRKEPATEVKVYYIRFTKFERILHLMVIVSFLGLALTGMTLKFPDFGFFQQLSAWLGGYSVTGFIHRACAVVTFAYFLMHLWHMALKLKRKQISFKEMFVGENSMVPKKRDLVEFWQTFKWFLNLGPQPKYGRWTYWEKFDDFAVFWGVAIIGFTGLILWFPEKFTLVLPGWIINVASVIHSDEALLATGFIFTIHFFNTHLRPEVFPMDPVIFTGRVSLEELKEQRPREYAWLVENGKLEGRLAGPPPLWLSRLAVVAGLTFLTIGVTLVVGIVWAMLVHYV